MVDSRDSDDRTPFLPSELAHRLLSRAVELDVLSRSGNTIEQLRTVAHELGVADEAFDRALAELRHHEPAGARTTLRSMWNALRAHPRSAELTAVANVATFGAFWGALGVATWLSRSAGFEWELDAALRIAVNVAGVSLAHRLRARPVGFVLATTAIAQLAEYAIHLVYGLDSAQGAATHFAVLLAAGLGVAIASWGRRDGRPMEREGGVEVDAAADVTPAATSLPDRLSASRVLRERLSMS